MAATKDDGPDPILVIIITGFERPNEITNRKAKTMTEVNRMRAKPNNNQTA